MFSKIRDRVVSYSFSIGISFLLIPLLLGAEDSPESNADQESQNYSFEEALDILNESQWARQQTITQVVEGVGSGEYGEKELFSRYYVRILSAPQIRSAYKIVQGQVEDKRDSADQDEFGLVGYDDPKYIIIGVAFRSNQPDLEGEVLNVLKSQTVETLQNRAFLSSSSQPQMRLVAYKPPTDLAIGAQFVFPRIMDGKSVISPDDESFAFELELKVELEVNGQNGGGGPGGGPGGPGGDDEEEFDFPVLRVNFPVSNAVTGPSEISLMTSGRGSENGPFEFQVFQSNQTGSVNLNSSRFAGAVNLFPKKTSRAIDGSVYWFHRNDNFDARNFFDPGGEPLPEYKRNQYGFSLGAELGPRLNVFGSFDGLRIIQGSTLLSNVPTPAMKRGDFSELLDLDDPVQLYDPFSGSPFLNNQIPQDRIHPVSKNLLSVFPNPNRDEEIRNFVNNQPEIQNVDTLSFRVDYGLSDRSQLVSRFQMTDADGIEVEPFPTFGGREFQKEYEASVSYTRTFSDTAVSNFRIEFDREEQADRSRDERPAGLLDSLGINGVHIEDPDDEGYPSFEVEGYPEFGDRRLPQREVSNRYQFDGDLTLTQGSHIFDLTGSFGWRQLYDATSNSLERGEFGFSGDYSGHGFADFLLGRANQATATVGSSRQDLRSGNFSFGISDEWRVLDRLTISLGLTYQYYSPYHSTRNNLSVFQPLLFEPPIDGKLVDLNEGRSDKDRISTVVRSDWNDFAPRIGFAYRPFGSGRFIVRASYSVDYDPHSTRAFEHYMGRNYPYFLRRNSQASNDSTGLDIGNPFNTETPTELAVRDIDPHIRTPYVQSLNFSIQSELADNWTLEFRYRGQRTIKEQRTIPANVPTPDSGDIQTRRPNPDYGQFTIITGGGSTLFYEFQANLRRRFANGFTFDAGLDIGRRFSNIVSRSSPSNPRNLGAEWGPSEFSPDRSFQLNFIYDLPFGTGRLLGEIPYIDFLLGGWQLSGIAQFTSGEAFTVRMPGDHNNDGLSDDRPDRISSGRLNSSERSIDRWFDTSAFAAPAPYTFGNAGRGILVGPGYNNWDLSLIKDFIFPNSHRLQLRFAFFNAFNHTNFEEPGRVFGTSEFGVITSARRAREIEIALRYLF